MNMSDSKKWELILYMESTATDVVISSLFIHVQHSHLEAVKIQASAKYVEWQREEYRGKTRNEGVYFF
jgi:hypothetical protein